MKESFRKKIKELGRNSSILHQCIENKEGSYGDEPEYCIEQGLTDTLILCLEDKDQDGKQNIPEDLCHYHIEFRKNGTAIVALISENFHGNLVKRLEKEGFKKGFETDHKTMIEKIEEILKKEKL